MPYEVSTPVYEGPFDLLLHLIAKEQVNLFEISLAHIVDAFVAEIDAMKALDLDVATEFLLIASTLIELKLRKLLPVRAGIDMDEELALLEERDLLLAKLLEYQTFRQAAAALARLEAAGARSYPRTLVVEEPFAGLTPDPLESATPEQIRNAFIRVLLRAFAPKPDLKVELQHVTEITLTVGDAADELAATLPGKGSVPFRSLLVGSEEVLEVVIRFLALLELYKQGWLELDQASNFGELMVCWCAEGGDVPADREPPSEGPASVQRVINAELSLDDVEDADAEAEIEEAIQRAAAERLDRSGAKPRVVDFADVDDYEG